ncbi:MAG: (Fe-S)-binding protein [Desulfobacterales bacterium]|nr:(Fe-S)-binding protein [Desulfobacterales bacterium]
MSKSEVKNEQAVTRAELPVDSKKIRDMLDAFDGARIRTWLKICSGCGLCAESCFFYLSGDNNVRFSPAYKVKHTLGEMYRRKGNVDREFLEACYDILWLQCTTCKRCSLFCPFGIDIATMISLARSICFSQGIRETGLVVLSENHRKAGNHSAVSEEDFIETCEWMEEETGDEIRGLAIPVDKPDVKYMYTVNPREMVFYPEELGMAAKILTVAEESWTMPTSGWDCTNLPMFMGDRDLAGKVVRSVYEKAADLGAENVLMTECGHAYRSLVFEGPYLAGYADGKPPIKIVHSVELFYEYIRDGKIKIDPAKKIREPVTYQDPCNISRNGGIWEEGRKLIKYLADDFRDMTPNREYNHCCGGGGGYIPMGPSYKSLRMASGRVKAEQIKKTGAKIVITPCHNCFDQIKDLNEEYELGVEVVSFKELICEMMIIPDKFVPEA